MIKITVKNEEKVQSFTFSTPEGVDEKLLLEYLNSDWDYNDIEMDVEELLENQEFVKSTYEHEDDYKEDYEVCVKYGSLGLADTFEQFISLLKATRFVMLNETEAGEFTAELI